MKRVKKMSLFALAMFMSSSASVLADVPNRTVVIGNKAYDLNYANDHKNLKEIIELVKANQDSDIYIKGTNGKWYDNHTSENVEKDLIPSITYKNQQGKVKVYEEEDGEKIDFKVESAYFSSDDQVSIKFSLPSDIDDLKKSIKIGGKTLEKGDEISLSEDGETITVKLSNKLKEENFTTSVEVENSITNQYGEAMNEGFKREILVVNDPSTNIDSNLNKDLNILSNNAIFKNIKIEGNLYLAGDNITLEEVEVSDALVVDSNKDSCLKLINSKLNEINLYSGADLNIEGGEIKAVNVDIDNDIVIKSDSNAKVENVKIKSSKAVVTLDGTFDNVISGFKVKEVKLAPNAKIKKLKLKSKTSIKGDKTNKIGKIDSPREEFKSDITEDIEENVEIKDNSDSQDGIHVPINKKISKHYETEALSLKIKGKKKSGGKASLQFTFKLKNEIEADEDVTIAIYDSKGKVIYIGQGDISNKEYSFKVLIERGNSDLYLRLPGVDKPLNIKVSF